MNNKISKVLAISLISCLLFVTAAPEFTPVQAYSGLYLSCYVPIADKPAADGNIESSEWSDAGKATFGPFTAVNDSETINGTLYMLNTGSNLYIAVKIDGDLGEGLTDDDGFQITFDNDHGNESDAEVGDDSLEMWGSFEYDGFWNGTALQSDLTDGGSKQLYGTAGRQGDENHFEMYHPLNTSDDAHDFSLKEGDTVGFVLQIIVDNFMYSLGSYNLGSGFHPSTYAEYIVGGRPTLSAYTATAPTIDGVMDPGEWSSADSADFVTDDSYARGTIYVMNDVENLYLLVKTFDNDTRVEDVCRIDFDNNNTGGPPSVGDDSIESTDYNFILDYFYDSSWSNEDTSYSGTRDGVSNQTQGDSLIWYFEFSHPLNTTDDAHDFSLSAGDIVGFNVVYLDYNAPASSRASAWPNVAASTNKTQFAKIKIAEIAELSTFGSEVIGASTNSVLFVYPATSGSKPSGVVNALFTDWTSIGILIGLCENIHHEILDTNTGSPLFVNSSDGDPGCSNRPIVTVGGPLVHSVVSWLEKKPTGSISPVYFGKNSTYYYFIDRGSGVKVSEILKTSTGSTTDYFVIYTVEDSDGNTYFVFYGIGYRGSMAATHKMLEWVKNGELGSHGSQYEIWKWEDTNGDGMVNSASRDNYTLDAIG